jgi:hypothetical protein
LRVCSNSRWIVIGSASYDTRPDPAEVTDAANLIADRVVLA